MGIGEDVPENTNNRLIWLEKWLLNWNRQMEHLENEVKMSLKKWYGEKISNTTLHTESFEIAEYGHQPADNEILRLFPMIEGW